MQSELSISDVSRNKQRTILTWLNYVPILSLKLWELVVPFPKWWSMLRAAFSRLTLWASYHWKSQRNIWEQTAMLNEMWFGHFPLQKARASRILRKYIVGDQSTLIVTSIMAHFKILALEIGRNTKNRLEVFPSKCSLALLSLASYAGSECVLNKKLW